MSLRLCCTSKTSPPDDIGDLLFSSNAWKRSTNNQILCYNTKLLANILLKNWQAERQLDSKSLTKALNKQKTNKSHLMKKTITFFFFLSLVYSFSHIELD